MDQIFKWYHDYQDVEGVARCVPLDEIKENDWNLNIPRYIEPVIEVETITVAEAIENLKTSLNAAYEAEEKLKELLLANGLCDPTTPVAGERHSPKSLPANSANTRE